MVSFSKLSGIGYQGGMDIAALQAASQYYNDQVERDLAKQALLRQGINTGGQMLDNFLTRKDKRDQKKQEQEALQQYYDAQLEVALGNGLLDPNAGYTEAPLELSSQLLPEVEAAKNVKQVGDNKFEVTAQNDMPAVNPMVNRLRNMTRYAAAAGITPDDIQKSYGLTELTPAGVKDKYTAMNTKSEYQALEDKPGTGTSRRTIGKDLELEQTRAQIAATNRSGQGGGNGKAKTNSAASDIANAWKALEFSLVDINRSSNSATRTGSGLLSKITGGNLGGDLGIKVDAYGSLKNAVGIELAKLGQSGNLTENEQKRAFALLPDPTQSIARQEQQYRAFASYINAKVGAQVLEPRVSLSGRGNATNQARQSDADLIRGY